MATIKEFLFLTVPFLITQYIYWIGYYIPTSQPSIFTLIIKCLPVSYLCFYVLSSYKHKVHNSFVKNIGFGLAFSVVGDASLVWDENESCFIMGMASFAIAQIFYISAFGLKPKKYNLLIPYVIYGLVLIVILLPKIDDIVILIAFPVYGILLLTTSWRALARSHTITSLLTAFGTILFVISDSTIAYDKFVHNLEYHQEIIMSTYYLAQYLISLSALEIITSQLTLRTTNKFK